MIPKTFLETNYVRKQLSAQQIAAQIGCSLNKVHYWLNKHGIERRSISAAVYARVNPQGDPFSFQLPKTDKDWFLFGIGLGLYWGEGNKANLLSVRLGNTDPDLVRYFLKFLEKMYDIDKKRLHFGLQIFSDCSRKEALTFWCKSLGVSAHSFHKNIVVTKSRKPGTYRKKNRHGVLTVYFSNTKLRDSIVGAIDSLRTERSLPS